MEGALIPIVVFGIVYAAITFEFVEKSVAALLGVMVLLCLHVVDEHTAKEFVDFETLMLLLGMMLNVAILRKSGFFAIVSIKIAELTKGNPLKILVLFSTVTAGLSAFLDNVTTVLIIIPIVIELTAGMGLDPKIYIISQAVISNVGGTGTLIGDPPNILIGSKVALTFNQFLFNLGPPVFVCFVVTVFTIWITNRSKFKPIDTDIAKLFSVQLLLEKIRLNYLDTKIEKIFLTKSLTCMIITILLFVTQTFTHLMPGVVAIISCTVLMIITGVHVEEMMHEVEWTTLLFFMGLFVLVGVLEEKGVIEWIARNVFLRVGDNPYVIVMTILWVSGIVSGFLDNIPFTITMIPIVRLILETTPVPNNIMWWALSLGACLGGNLTMIGASANIVSVGMAKKFKIEISFFEFMKKSAILTFLTLIVSSIYLFFYLTISL